MNRFYRGSHEKGKNTHFICQLLGIYVCRETDLPPRRTCRNIAIPLGTDHGNRTRYDTYNT